MTVYMGVDPGARGAIAWIDERASGQLNVDVAILPYEAKQLDLPALQTFLKQTLAFRPGDPIVGIEQQQAMLHTGRTIGASQAFSMGVNFGKLLATFSALSIGYELVPASRWKTAMRLSSDKAVSLHRAKELFPALAEEIGKHDGKAEALLLAHYLRTRRREP